VINLGQQATGLWSPIRSRSTPSMSRQRHGRGQLVGDQVQWSLAVLTPGESRTLSSG